MAAELTADNDDEATKTTMVVVAMSRSLSLFAVVASRRKPMEETSASADDGRDFIF